MAIMSGCFRLREIALFMKVNGEELRAALQIQRKDVPSHVTVRNIMMGVSIEGLIDAFNRWARPTDALQPAEIISLDGKALKSTVVEHDNNLQDFACIVSAYVQRLGVVIAGASFHNRSRSEVAVVQHLIEQLNTRGAILTLDALHSTKKRSRRSSTVAMTTSSPSRRTVGSSTLR
jgi:hypothetical protein